MFKLIENPQCPTCSNPLLKVRQSSNTRYKYYWDRELGIEEGD